MEQALKASDHVDLLILDGPPRSNAATLKMARASNLVLLPTGLALDDLQPHRLIGA